MEAGSREGGESARELHGIEEGVGGGGGLLVGHLLDSDHHHHRVLGSRESLRSQLGTDYLALVWPPGTCSVHQHKISTL